VLKELNSLIGLMASREYFLVIVNQLLVIPDEAPAYYRKTHNRMILPVNSLFPLAFVCLCLWVGRVCSAREKSLQILCHRREINPGHGEDNETHSFSH